MADFYANKLTCIRDERVLFQDLDIGLNAGDIVLVQGANGSGKSSLLRLLSGLAEAESGNIYWQGASIQDCRYQYQRQLLYFGHTYAIKPELTAIENLLILKQLGLSQTQIDMFDILAQIGLAGFEEVPTRMLSAGQKRRVALARLWISQAKLWILDEPFTALDTKGMEAIEARICQQADQGGMVIFTTHHSMSIHHTARTILL